MRTTKNPNDIMDQAGGGGDVGGEIRSGTGNTRENVALLENFVFSKISEYLAPFPSSNQRSRVAVKRARTVYQRGNQGGWRICTTHERRVTQHGTQNKKKTFFGQN